MRNKLTSLIRLKKFTNESKFQKIFNEFPTVEICDFDQQFLSTMGICSIFLQMLQERWH